MNVKTSFFVSLFVLCTGVAHAQYQQINDISYKQSTDAYAKERCKLDVYYPTDKQNAPVVVWFHGGGIEGGSKHIDPQLRNSGLVVVAANYRLLPKAHIDDILDDVAAAVAWTYKNIEKYGGRVLTRQKVTKIVCDETHATGVETMKGEFFPADYIISDAHPMRTLELTDSKLIRPAFRQRINAIPQTVGVFAVYIEFKDDKMPYMAHNFYGYTDHTPWDSELYDEATWPKSYLYMHFCQETNPQFARTGVILAYMQMKDVEKWLGTHVGRRGDDYEAFKQRKAERLIDTVEKNKPGLRSSIKHYYTSTPLTYLDYTGTEGGSLYGIAKDIHLGVACRVPHKTKIPNLFQTGQNINSHGMLGVIVGSVITCSELLTAARIYQQIIDTNQ